MSKIILCCPFFNENLIANLNIEEASKWVDEIHVTEFDKSFKYKLHEHCFHNRNEKVYYHPMDASKLYKKPRAFIPPSNPQLSSSASFLRLNVLSSLN